MNESPEPMARLHWKFTMPGWPGVIIQGASDHRELSIAQSVARILNESYGEGSHWVEPLNETFDELLGKVSHADFTERKNVDQ